MRSCFNLRRGFLSVFSVNGMKFSVAVSVAAGTPTARPAHLFIMPPASLPLCSVVPTPLPGLGLDPPWTASQVPAPSLYLDLTAVEPSY